MGRAAEDVAALGLLLRADKPAEAVALADAMLEPDPTLGGDDTLLAHLLLNKLGALLNLEYFDRCPAVADAAAAALARCDEPALQGEFHALSGGLAYWQGSLERCVTHLVRGARALQRVRSEDQESAMAWLDLATTYSYIGFHEEAVATLARAGEAAEKAGEPAGGFVHPEIRVRHALWLDHQGDGAGCVRELFDLYDSASPEDLAGFDLAHLGFAGARLAALGVAVSRDPGPLLAASSAATPEGDSVIRLAEACLAIAGGRPAEALTALDAPFPTGTVPKAEVLRLRTLALAAAGDYKAALAAERAAVAAIVNGPGRLNRLYIEGITARLDQDELRRSVTRYSDEAHTDALTGLPNRRHLERFVATLAGRGAHAAIGVADLNGFKAVNTTHGHQSGDEVLQQVAALLSRALRAGDFLARYGGDEFVVILPGTSMDEAADISGRLIGAVAGFDWATLVPATPVSLAIGLAELRPGTDFSSAFQAADLVMLREKATGAAQ